MADPKNPAQRAPLPPGCRFFPTEQQLLRHYLRGKNSVSDDHSNVNMIGEFDVLGHDPFELVEIGCFEYGIGGRRRHWYCYSPRVERKRTRMRRTRGGYWKRKGKVRDVVGEGGVVTGKRTEYVFMLGEFGAKSGLLTDWVVYEYALIEEDKDFVLCRAFEKSRQREDASHAANFGVSGDSCLHDSSDLASIMEQGDFIELDDLLKPLPSMDNAGS
uniref:NAC domain-containing protein n=1 Tax=Kalanchoe fedtschenkoi TaxID=63787 RepID=A0A7N0UWW5_KALFE